MGMCAGVCGYACMCGVYVFVGVPACVSDICVCMCVRILCTVCMYVRYV